MPGDWVYMCYLEVSIKHSDGEYAITDKIVCICAALPTYLTLLYTITMFWSAGCIKIKKQSPYQMGQSSLHS